MSPKGGRHSTHRWSCSVSSDAGRCRCGRAAGRGQSVSRAARRRAPPAPRPRAPRPHWRCARIIRPITQRPTTYYRDLFARAYMWWSATDAAGGSYKNIRSPEPGACWWAAGAAVVALHPSPGSRPVVAVVHAAATHMRGHAARKSFIDSRAPAF